jgi:hypothetical protein
VSILRGAGASLVAHKVGSGRHLDELRQAHDYTWRGELADRRTPAQIVADVRAVLVARDPELAAIVAVLAERDAGK